MKPSYVYAAKVVRVIDGDTIAAEVDLGFYVQVKMSLRLSGLNAREVGQEGGPEARDHLAAMLPPGTQIVVQSVKPDKYAGRADAVVVLADGTNLNRELLAEGWAAPYDGKGLTSDHVPTWPRA